MLLNKVDGFNPEEWLEAARDAQGLYILGADKKPLRYMRTDAKILWFRLLCPRGRLISERIPSDSPSIVCFRASVYLDLSDPAPVSTTEYQRSWREHCGDFDAFVAATQTIALGKALSRAGFGCELDAMYNMDRDDVEVSEETGETASVPQDGPVNRPAEEPKMPGNTQVSCEAEQDIKKTEKTPQTDSLEPEGDFEPSGDISLDEILRSMDTNPDAGTDAEEIVNNLPPAIDIPDDNIPADNIPVDDLAENNAPADITAPETSNDEQEAFNTVFRLKDNAEELGISQGLITLSWQNVTLGEILKDHADFLKVILDHKKIREGIDPEVVKAAEIIRAGQTARE